MSTLLVCVSAVVFVVVGFVALDRWHRRWAWREAERWAREQMARKYGDKP